MTEMLYVITAEILNREQDGIDPQDGSPLQKVYTSRETWIFPATAQIGEIMAAVTGTGAHIITVTLTEDRATAEKVREERLAATRVRREAEDRKNSINLSGSFE